MRGDRIDIGISHIDMGYPATLGGALQVRRMYVACAANARRLTRFEEAADREYGGVCGRWCAGALFVGSDGNRRRLVACCSIFVDTSRITRIIGRLDVDTDTDVVLPLPA